MTTSLISRRRHRGFTLIELTVSLALLSIILTALGSVVMLATRAAPSARSRIDTQARIAMDMIAVEIRDAVKVTTASARAFQFEVADRDSDSANETIRYTWTGTSGDPIMRSYKGAAAVAVSDGMSAVSFAYTTTTRSRAAATAATEGAEQLLAMYVGTTNGNMLVRNTTWPAQVFTPTLPSDAVSWRITKVLFLAKNGSGLLGTIGVQIRTADPLTQLPNSTVIDEQSILQVNLGSTSSWFTCNYTCSAIPAGTPGAIVWRSTLGSSPMVLPYVISGVPDAGASLPSWGTGSSTWGGTLTDASVNYQVYGKVTRPGSTSNSITLVQTVTLSMTPVNGTALSTVVRVAGGGEE